MQYEKIIRKKDGSRVRLQIRLIPGYEDTVDWDTVAYVCEKGKRTWKKLIDTDSRDYRCSQGAARLALHRQAVLTVLSEDELEAALLEVWQLLKPNLYTTRLKIQ